MRGYLIRVGVDQAYGKWNGPMDPATNDFVYVPIPEKRPMRPGLATPYAAVTTDLARFAARHGDVSLKDVRLPGRLYALNMHLDPDFTQLTYGDSGLRRGLPLTRLGTGDLILFYGGLKPTTKCEHRLVYALFGLYRVAQVSQAGSLAPSRFGENAHTRCSHIEGSDIIVHAQPATSGRFRRCIPFGAFRDGAYRVNTDILQAWGGLSCRDGYIQRSGVLPALLEPERVLAWLDAQQPELVTLNNLL